MPATPSNCLELGRFYYWRHFTPARLHGGAALRQIVALHPEVAEGSA